MIAVQFFKYFIASGIAFILDFFLLWFLTEILDIYYLISASISFFSGLLMIYILSINWVFNQRKVENKKKEFLIFTLVGIIGIIINTSGIWFLTEKLDFHYLESKIIITFIVFIWNFLARKIILF